MAKGDRRAGVGHGLERGLATFLKRSLLGLAFRFVLYVIDAEGVIRDRSTGDYPQAKQRVLSHLLA